MIRLALFGLTGIVGTGIGFMVGLYATFPSEKALEWLAFQVDKNTNHEYAIGAESVHPWWAAGLSFDSLQVYTVKRGRRVKDQPQTWDRTPFVHFESLSIRAAPLSFLTGRQGYAFDAELLGGALDGVYSFSEALVDLSFDLDGLDLAEMGTGSTEVALNLVGQLGGEGDLTLNLKEIKESTGNLAFAIEGFGIAAGSKMSGFDLPVSTFTTAKLGFEVRDGKMTVTEGLFEGDVISATLSGDVTLNKKLSRSRSKLDLGFTLPEELQTLADLVPTLKRSKDADGVYHCNIQGTISAPSFRCGKGMTPKAVRESALGGPSDDGPRVLGGATGENSELSDEERRAKREERIKERRERLRKRREEQGSDPLTDPPRLPAVPFGPEDDPVGIEDRFQDPPDLPEDFGPPDEGPVEDEP